MKRVNSSNSASRHNYIQLLFVFAAFAVMALAAYFFIGSILRNRLLSGAEELLYSAEANVKAGLSEAETSLTNSYYIVRGMIEKGASKQEILDYLTTTTEWMRQRDQGLLDFYGIYGFIHGEFYDGLGMNPDIDYIPQTRPWYQTALRSGTSVAYTSPYRDWHTSDTIVSAVRVIDLENREIVGILTVDININWLLEYVGSLALATDGYGIFLSQNMTIMAHPDYNYLGHQLQELGGSYEEISRTLRSGGEVFARQIRDQDGGLIIVFFKRIFNNWYVGIITPYSQFYQDLNSSAQILFVLGLVLSLSLCSILLHLSRARMRADEESKAKSSFLARMSHEIRTPMNAITGMTELLLRGNLSDEARKYAQDIKQAGVNLVSIINDILDISKIEAGKLEIIPVKYLFSSLINDTINIIRMRLIEKPIQFNTNIDGNIPNGLIGDQTKLRQIFLNLLSNAVKYTERGHINLAITVEKRVDKQVWLKIIVSDTGKGIKPEDQSKLFGDFVQLDVKKNLGIEGTGLGLSITKHLCLAMYGDINVESEYGKGSTFTVIIPQVVESEELFILTNEIENKSDTSDMIRFTLPRVRLLIVDDIPTNLKVAEGLLSPYRATVETCLSGAEAIEKIKKQDYDIVFMDHMMPEMDGIETTTAIRALDDRRFKTIPIIALTANAISGMREMFIEKGFNDFLAKPIDVFKLDEILEQWIPKEKKQQDVVIVKNDKSEKNATALPNQKSQVPDISGVDVKRGIAMTGGTVARYCAVLSIFRNDAQERLPLLKNMPTADNLPVFVTQVHALKSASASIGAAEISASAAAIEAAGKNGDLALIEKLLPSFAKNLAELIDGISSWEIAAEEKELSGSVAEGKKQKTDSNAAATTSLLHKLAKALEVQKLEEIDRILEELMQHQDSGMKATLDKISDEVLMAEYVKAREILTGLLDKGSN